MPTLPSPRPTTLTSPRAYRPARSTIPEWRRCARLPGRRRPTISILSLTARAGTFLPRLSPSTTTTSPNTAATSPSLAIRLPLRRGTQRVSVLPRKSRLVSLRTSLVGDLRKWHDRFSDCGLSRPWWRNCGAVRGPRQSACATVSEPTSFCSAFEGLGVEAVAEQLDTTAKTRLAVVRPVCQSSLDGLAHAPGRGRRTSIAEAKMSGSLPRRRARGPAETAGASARWARHVSLSASQHRHQSHRRVSRLQAYGDRSVDNSVIAIARYQAHEKFLSCR